MAEAALRVPSRLDAAGRARCARWLVLSRGARSLARTPQDAQALPPPPEEVRQHFGPQTVTHAAAIERLPLGSVADPPSFRLGTLLQELLEWSFDEQGAAGPIGRSERRRLGAFYTPRALVDRVVGLALQAMPAHRGDPCEMIRVCDPACGSGNFLSGVAAALPAASTRSLVGVDVDPLAAWSAEASLVLDRREAIGHHSIRCGDALVGELSGCNHDAPLAREIGTKPIDWRAPFDLVIGNPPFLGQLTGATSRSRAMAAYLRDASHGVITGYADAAAAFLWRSVMLAAPNGIVSMIVPRSILASRDASPLRSFVEASADVVRIEPIDGTPFDAGVQPCIVVLRRHPERSVRPSMQHKASAWVLSETQTPSGSGPTLDSICGATADFRDAYYGLRPFIVEDADGTLDEKRFPRLITCGLIEPGFSLWGMKRVRIFKQTWQRPRIDLTRLLSDTHMAQWVSKRLVPKVLVATQTRGIECVADERGEWLPLTPVISVVPHAGVPLGRVLKALSGRIASDAAIRMAAGTGMSAQVIRLTARQIGQLPLSV